MMIATFRQLATSNSRIKVLMKVGSRLKLKLKLKINP